MFIIRPRLKPDYAKAHNNLGVLRAKQGQLLEAVTHFQRALDAKPDYVQARDNLRQVQTLLQKNESPPNGR